MQLLIAKNTINYKEMQFINREMHLINRELQLSDQQIQNMKKQRCFSISSNEACTKRCLKNMETVSLQNLWPEVAKIQTRSSILFGEKSLGPDAWKNNWKSSPRSKLFEAVLNKIIQATIWYYVSCDIG